jgi:hypothetical protein
MQLRANYNVDEAKKIIFHIRGEKRKNKLQNLKYNELFYPNRSEIYFLDLAKIISTQWDIFKNIFSYSKKEMYEKLDFINHSRTDGHAKTISDDKFFLFRIYMTDIEKDLEELI